MVDEGYDPTTGRHWETRINDVLQPMTYEWFDQPPASQEPPTVHVIPEVTVVGHAERPAPPMSQEPPPVVPPDPAPPSQEPPPLPPAGSQEPRTLTPDDRQSATSPGGVQPGDTAYAPPNPQPPGAPGGIPSTPGEPSGTAPGHPGGEQPQQEVPNIEGVALAVSDYAARLHQTAHQFAEGASSIGEYVVWKAVEIQAANLHLAEDMFVNPLLAAPAHLRVAIERDAAAVRELSDGHYRAALTESVKANQHLQEVALAILSVIPFEGSLAKSAGWGERLVVQATKAERAAAQKLMFDLVQELSAAGREVGTQQLYELAASRLLPRADVQAAVKQITAVTTQREVKPIEEALRQSIREVGDSSRFGQKYHELVGAAERGVDLVEPSGRFREVKTTLVPIVDRFVLEKANHQLVGYLLRDLAEQGTVRPGVVEHLFVRPGPGGTVREAVRLVLDPLGGKPITHLIPGG